MLVVRLEGKRDKYIDTVLSCDTKNILPYTPLTKLPDNELQFKHLTFPITVCSITYGDYPELPLRSLRGLYDTLDESKFKLRFGMNAPSERCEKQLLDFLETKSNVEIVYIAKPQLFKSPMMRKLFRDKEHPITTDWIMFFDDDACFTSNEWIKDFGKTIDRERGSANKRFSAGIAMFGLVRFMRLSARLISYIKAARWFKKKPFVLVKARGDRATHNYKVDFVTGGLWLITTEAVNRLDWPDPRLTQKLDDVLLGAALRQNDYGIASVKNGFIVHELPSRGTKTTQIL